MAVPQKCMALLLFFTFCAINNEVESTIILMSAEYEKANVWITNDLRLPVTIEGPGVGLSDVHSTMNFTFVGSGMISVKEDGQGIFESNLKYDYINIVRTHSMANLTKRLGDIYIRQDPSELNLEIQGDEESKHTFLLQEGKSVTGQMVSANGNKIEIRQASNRLAQSFGFFGVFKHYSYDKVEPDDERIIIKGKGKHGTFMLKGQNIMVVMQMKERLPLDDRKGINRISDWLFNALGLKKFSG